MRLFSRLLIGSLLFQATSTAALAAPLAFTATGSNVTAFEGDIPAKTIGGLLLPKGSVSISGTSIDVNAVPDWLFDKHIVLSGVVINSKLNTVGDHSDLNGLAYFTRGDWLTNLGRNQASEIVSTTDGVAYSGRVGSLTNNTLQMILADGSRKSVDFTQVASITSPRAFSFRIPANAVHIEPSDGSYQAEVSGITFTPAMFHGGLTFISHKPQVPKSTLPGSEGGISNKYIASMVIVDIMADLAPAISIPIIFGKPIPLHTRQLLFGNANNGDSQPFFSSQIWADGSVHPFPFR